MKIQLWRASFVFLVAFGMVISLTFPAARVSASNGSEQNKISTADAWGNCWYRVQRGDNLFRIALRYGVSYWYLAHLNGLWNPNWIYAGMILRVPCGGKPPPPPPPLPCEQTAQYVVQPGDNLFRIALNYGTTVNAIRDANNLWGKVLRPGMTLVIPCPKLTNGTDVPPPSTKPAQPTPIPNTEALPPEPAVSINLGAQVAEPNVATIRAGQSVVFINNSENIYTVISGLPGQPNGDFNSPPLEPGATFVQNFTATGNFSYYVNENPTLIGQVLVNP